MGLELTGSGICKTPQNNPDYNGCLINKVDVTTWPVDEWGCFSGKTLTGELALGKYKIPQVTEAEEREGTLILSPLSLSSLSPD